MFSASLAKKTFNVSSLLSTDASMQLQKKIKEEKQKKYTQLLRNKVEKRRKDFFHKASANNKTYTQGFFLSGKDFESPRNARSGSKSPEKRISDKGNLLIVLTKNS